MGLRWALAVAFAAALASLGGQADGGAARDAPTTRGAVRVWPISYRAHNGVTRRAYVTLPRWYGPRNAPELPLIVSPHGRGLTGRSNSRIWGQLPARGRFAVVSPDGMGRRLGQHSWGYPGQIDDLARMPEIARRALPWLRVDPARIYAFGGSMGGQETLLLVAKYPGLLAGAAAFDAVADFGRQYRSFPRLRCRSACRGWPVSFGRRLQLFARREVGGDPRRAARAFAQRSPIAYVRAIASSCVPLQLWWSVADLTVVNQRLQSRRLFWELKRRNPLAPVQAFAGFWIHGAEMHARSRLPLALAAFGLLSRAPARGPRLYHVPAPRAAVGCGLDAVAPAPPETATRP